jgi:hypothetical protein
MSRYGDWKPKRDMTTENVLYAIGTDYNKSAYVKYEYRDVTNLYTNLEDTK